LSTFLLISLSLGALGAINTWDLPTYFLLVAGAFLVAAWRGRRVTMVIAAGVAAGLTGVLAVAAYWPFYAHYQALVGGESGPLIGRYLGWVHGASPLGRWLVVWGFFLFLALSFVRVELFRWPAVETRGRKGTEGTGGTEGAMGTGGTEEVEGTEGIAGIDGTEGTEGNPDSVGDEGAPETGGADADGEGVERVVDAGRRSRHVRLMGLLAAVGLAALLVVLERPTAGLAIVPLVLALAFAVRRWTPPENAFVMLLLALGLGIVAGTELIYLRDFLDGGDWYRMNTLFKFSVPAWLFLGLAGGVMLPRVWATAGRRPIWLRWPWRGLVLLLLVFGLAFLPLGVPSRVRDRFPGPRPAIGTPDGAAFMTVGRYSWPDSKHTVELAYDYLAIHWLLDHVTGTPVVAEAPAGGYTVAGQSVGYDYYRAGGLRVASLTGFPTFVGQHQYEQRPADQVGERTRLGQTFFSTTDIARARELMRELRVGYIYVGTLERTLFSVDALRKFDVLVELGELEVVYQNSRVTIYRLANER